MSLRHFATTVFDMGKLKLEYVFKKIIYFFYIQIIHSKLRFIFEEINNIHSKEKFTF